MKHRVEGKEEDINAFEDAIDEALYQEMEVFYMNRNSDAIISKEIWVVMNPKNHLYTKRFAGKTISELTKQYDVKVDSADMWVDFGSGKESKIIIRGKAEDVNQYIKELGKQLMIL